LVLKGAKARGPALSATAGQGSDINGGRLVLDYTGETSPAATVLPLLVTGFGQATKFSTGAIRSSGASVANDKGIGYFDGHRRLAVQPCLHVFRRREPGRRG
jgi:hypothetical protein